MAIFLKSFLFNLISPNHIKFTTNYFNTYCRKKQEETLKNAGNPVGFAAGFSMVGREGLPDGTRGPAPQTVRRRGKAPLPFGRISGLRRRFLLRAKDGSGPASAPEGCGTNACGDCPLALRDCGAEPDRGVLCRNFGERKTGGQWGGIQRTGCTGEQGVRRGRKIREGGPRSDRRKGRTVLPKERRIYAPAARRGLHVPGMPGMCSIQARSFSSADCAPRLADACAAPSRYAGNRKHARCGTGCLLFFGHSYIIMVNGLWRRRGKCPAERSSGCGRLRQGAPSGARTGMRQDLRG